MKLPCTIFLILFCAAANLLAASELPIDLSYTMKSLGKEDQPALSPDGKWIVYGVWTPPEMSPGSELESEPRFLPNGTPSGYVGSRLYLAGTASSQITPICLEKGNCWRPVWSPDSSKVAFYSDTQGAPQLWIYDLKQRNSRRVSDAKIKAKLWMGDEAYWSPDSKEVYVPLAPAGATNEPAVGPDAANATKAEDQGIRVYSSGTEVKATEKKEPTADFTEFFLRENNATLAAIKIESGAVREIVSAQTEPRPSCLTLSPSGKWIAYLSVYRIPDLTGAKAFYDLAVVSSQGGTVRTIAKDLDVNDIDYYTIAYRWRPNADQLVYYKGKKAFFVDLNDSKLESRQVAPKLGEIAPFPILFTADGERLLLGTKPLDRQDYYGLWPLGLAIVSLKTDDAKAMDFAAGLDFDQAIRASGNTLWEPAKNTFASIWRNPETGEKSIFQTDLNSGKSTMLKKEIGRFHFIGSASPDGALFGTYEDAATPGDVYRFDGRFATRKRISNVEPRFENIRLGSVEFFQTELPQYNGKIVKAQTAVILPPGGKKGDRLPALIFHYGGLPLSKDADRFLAGSPASVPISVFVTRGYAALLTDLVMGPQGTAGEPLQNMVDFILPQIYRASQLGYIDINRVALIGQSYGGYSTAGIITKTNLFRAAVAISGEYDLAGDYAWMSNGITPWMNWSESGQGRMGQPPWSDLQRYIANSPYYLADKIQTPLLLIHGGNDHTCPVQGAEKMFNALKRLNKTAQLAVYEKEGHTINNWSLSKAVDATERILKFLDTYLRVK